MIISGAAARAQRALTTLIPLMDHAAKQPLMP